MVFIILHDLTLQFTNFSQLSTNPGRSQSLFILVNNLFSNARQLPSRFYYDNIRY